jgi:glutaredoxin
MWIARNLLSILFFLMTASSVAEPAVNYPNSTVDQIKVDLFLSSTCPHCHKADEFFKLLESQLSWIVVHRYIVDQDKSALDEFYKHLQAVGSYNFAVPGIFFCNSRWTGFVDTNSSGKILYKALSYCHEQIKQQGELSTGTVEVLKQWSQVNAVMISPSIADSHLKFILFTALMDSISPCSLFCLMLFFAFIWLFPTHRRTQWLLGIVFIVALMAIHFVAQIFSGFFYQRLLMLRLPAAMMGLVLLSYVLFCFQRLTNRRQLIAKRTACILLPISVWIVFIYQQTCVLNLSLIFEQWLIKNPVSVSRFFSYVSLYHLIYLIPLVLVLVIYQLLSPRSRIKKYQNALKYAAGILLAAIAFLLIAYPLWLSHRNVSLIVFMSSILIGYFLEKYYERKRRL